MPTNFPPATRRLVAVQLRQLATDIERGHASEHIVREADYLVDAWRDQDEAMTCDCCGAESCDCHTSTVDADGTYYEAGRVVCLTHQRAVD